MKEVKRNALFAMGWKMDGDIDALMSVARPVYPIEVLDETMARNLFCPMCGMKVIRKPKVGDRTSSGAIAHFAHLSSGKKDVDCIWRSKKVKAKKYASVEEAQRAIANGELVVITSFFKCKPERSERASGASKVIVDDVPKEEVPLSIVKSMEGFALMQGSMNSVVSICKDFPRNLSRCFALPGMKKAYPLADLLHDFNHIDGADEEPKLYYGKLGGLWPREPANPKHNQSVYIAKEPRFFGDELRLWDSAQSLAEKSISLDASGRVVLVYGVIKQGNEGLRIENLGWGEYSLLPREYEDFLYPKN